MKFPLAVTASDGKKYFEPSLGPFTPYLFGSIECKKPITTTTSPTANPTRRA